MPIKWLIEPKENQPGSNWIWNNFPFWIKSEPVFHYNIHEWVLEFEIRLRKKSNMEKEKEKIKKKVQLEIKVVKMYK